MLKKIKKLRISIGWIQVAFVIIVIALGIALACGWITLPPVTPYN